MGKGGGEGKKRNRQGWRYALFTFFWLRNSHHPVFVTEFQGCGRRLPVHFTATCAHFSNHGDVAVNSPRRYPNDCVSRIPTVMMSVCL